MRIFEITYEPLYNVLAMGTQNASQGNFELILDSAPGTARVCEYKFALHINLAPLMAELN